jgi:hypothetical protein
MSDLTKSARSLFLVLAVVALASPVQAERLLRWKLKPGEAIDVRLVQDMDMTSTVLGKKLGSSADMSMVMRWNVENVGAEGVSQLRQSIQRLRMSMQTPGSDPVVYDSANASVADGMAKQLAENMAPLIGVEFIQSMSSRGEIIDVRLSDEAAAKLAKSPASAQLQQVFSKEGIKSLMHQAATVLPEKSVKPGDQWTGQTRTDSPVGTLIMNNTYTYRGTVDKDGRTLDRIDVDVNVTFAKGDNRLGVDVQIKQQQNKGVMYFDVAQGRFVETLLAQKMTMVTAIADQRHEQELDTKLRMQFSNAVPTTAARGGRTASAPAAIRGR